MKKLEKQIKKVPKKEETSKMTLKWLQKFVAQGYGQAMQEQPCHVCFEMPKEKHSFCSGCLKAVYCSSSCQRRDWYDNHHQLICGGGMSSDDDEDADPNVREKKMLGQHLWNTRADWRSWSCDEQKEETNLAQDAKIVREQVWMKAREDQYEEENRYVFKHYGKTY